MGRDDEEQWQRERGVGRCEMDRKERKMVKIIMEEGESS